MAKDTSLSTGGPADREVGSNEALVLASPETAGAAPPLSRPGRPHLVVVVTRPVANGEGVPAGSLLVTRFWHPRDRRWSENHFESLEHALRLFVDESGWVLRQQQELNHPHAWELIFEARREDFANLTTTELLEVVGLSKERVEKVVAKVDRSKKAAEE
ncbi:MAG TPA: hypothetical protein VGQ69_09775 [Gemmatimonadales bacterium]|jgi:hypothetical protein|nr:hypothetical protein [Gemmatimonadales bacterium]